MEYGIEDDMLYTSLTCYPYDTVADLNLIFTKRRDYMKNTCTALNGPTNVVVFTKVANYDLCSAEGL